MKCNVPIWNCNILKDCLTGFNWRTSSRDSAWYWRGSKTGFCRRHYARNSLLRTIATVFSARENFVFGYTNYICGNCRIERNLPAMGLEMPKIKNDTFTTCNSCRNSEAHLSGLPESNAESTDAQGRCQLNIASLSHYAKPASSSILFAKFSTDTRDMLTMSM